MSYPIEGGCLCGGVRYRVYEAPKQLSDCHCIDCRRACGAPYVTWGAFRRAKIEVLSGELRKVVHAGRLRSFAACCGTQLLIEDNETTEWIDLTIASLDQPQSFPPEAAIWTEDKLPWATLNSSQRVFVRDRV